MHFPRGYYQACASYEQDFKRMRRIHAKRKIHLAGALNDGVCHINIAGNTKRMTHDLTQVTCGHCQAWITRVIDNRLS
jgi:hypothetical protein